MIFETFRLKIFSQHRSDVSGISVYLLIVFAWPSETRLFVWMVHLLVTSWFILSWILDSHGFCTSSCIKGTQEPSASQGFHFRSFMWQFFQLYLDQQKNCCRKGSNRVAQVLPTAACGCISTSVFRWSSGGNPRKIWIFVSQRVAARIWLRNHETTDHCVFVFLVSWKRISLKAGAVVGKFCSKRGGGSQKSHGIYSATCKWQTMMMMPWPA